MSSSRRARPTADGCGGGCLTSHGLLGQAARAWSFDKTCSPADGGVRAATGSSTRGEGAAKTSYVSRSQRQLTYGPNEATLLSVGDVRIVEEEDNPYIIC